MLKKELGDSEIEELFWINSMVVLGYINNQARPHIKKSNCKKERRGEGEERRRRRRRRGRGEERHRAQKYTQKYTIQRVSEEVIMQLRKAAIPVNKHL
ncbi:hypothetical protein D4764_11G0003400 [Takifugu flavidus]|uniref:Uncharacterized protein n=1 Tax=Takifugu flavidus TaxID=433684 RepID=A0A5C6PH29_9TELE|nr:hypothetical protein D4764_11G0003400 [Takifugu flavidus]